MRVAFEDFTVHERAGVALICVANHVFGCVWSLAGKFPFQTGGEASATTPTKFGVEDGLDHRFRGHFTEDLCQGLVTINCDVVLNISRIDLADVFKDDANFLVFGLAEFFVGDIPHLSFVLLEFAALDEMFHHDWTDSCWGQLDVMTTFGVNQNIGTVSVGITHSGDVQDLDFL